MSKHNKYTIKSWLHVGFDLSKLEGTLSSLWPVTGLIRKSITATSHHGLVNATDEKMRNIIFTLFTEKKNMGVDWKIYSNNSIIITVNLIMKKRITPCV